MGHLGEKRLFLLDMDGTIYLDETLFPGTVPFLDAVRERGDGTCSSPTIPPNRWKNTWKSWPVWA